MTTNNSQATPSNVFDSWNPREDFFQVVVPALRKEYIASHVDAALSQLNSSHVDAVLESFDVSELRSPNASRPTYRLNGNIHSQLGNTLLQSNYETSRLEQR